jgi:hypothetical protein
LLCGSPPWISPTTLFGAVDFLVSGAKIGRHEINRSSEDHTDRRQFGKGF